MFSAEDESRSSSFYSFNSSTTSDEGGVVKLAAEMMMRISKSLMNSMTH